MPTLQDLLVAVQEAQSTVGRISQSLAVAVNAHAAAVAALAAAVQAQNTLTKKPA